MGSSEGTHFWMQSTSLTVRLLAPVCFLSVLQCTTVCCVCVLSFSLKNFSFFYVLISFLKQVRVPFFFLVVMALLYHFRQVCNGRESLWQSATTTTTVLKCPNVISLIRLLFFYLSSIPKKNSNLIAFERETQLRVD